MPTHTITENMSLPLAYLRQHFWEIGRLGWALSLTMALWWAGQSMPAIPKEFPYSAGMRRLLNEQPVAPDHATLVSLLLK